MAKNYILKDKGLKKISREMKIVNNSYVKIGVLGKKSTWTSGAPANLADIAAFNEYGTEHIPSRPFMRQSFDKNIIKITRFTEKMHSKVLSAKLTERQALHDLGVFFKGEVQDIFRTGNFKENAKSTIIAKTKNGKRGDTPLINEGHLRGSINFEVVIK